MSIVADVADGADGLIKLFSPMAVILIVRVPNRPSRPRTISIPSVRRKVRARRSRPASARGLFGQPCRFQATGLPTTVVPAFIVRSTGRRTPAAGAGRSMMDGPARGYINWRSSVIRDFASAASASPALLRPGLWPRRRMSLPRSRPIVADAAVGADDVFGSPAHPDDARPGSTFTTEGYLDAQGTQSRLHPPQAAGECPRIFWPAGTSPGGAVTGKFGLSTQEIRGATRPGAALSHNLPHASGHRIGVDDALDCGPPVGLVGPSEPPMKVRRFSSGLVHMSDFILPLQTDKFTLRQSPRMG